MPDAVSRPIACVPCSNYFENDNRVLRTCLFLRDRGYEVHVLAVGRADLPTSEDLEEGIHVHRFAPKTKRPLSMAMSPFV